MADELKPCPFCGGQAMLRRAETGEPWRDLGAPRYLIVRAECPKCRVFTCDFQRAHFMNDDIEALAIAAWNRRVGETP